MLKERENKMESVATMGTQGAVREEGEVEDRFTPVAFRVLMEEPAEPSVESAIPTAVPD